MKKNNDLFNIQIECNECGNKEVSVVAIGEEVNSNDVDFIVISMICNKCNAYNDFKIEKAYSSEYEEGRDYV